MPLINFRTNLTALKFGMDRPGGGDSGQPYIQFPIENSATPNNIQDYYNLNRTSLDFPIRGGAISALVNGSYSALSATVDRERIQKFFNDPPRGKTFIEKQIGLQLSNPKTQVPNTLQFAGISLGNAVLPVTQVYNPLNTLAQVQVQGTGAHFNRQGVVPTIYEPVQQTYEYIAGNPANNTETTNRLAILKTLKLIQNTNFLTSSTTAQGLGIDPILVDRLGISTIQNQLFNYSGGPGSTYGIGFTRIFRATDTNATALLANQTRGFTINGNPTPTGVNQPYSAIALTYRQIAEQNTRSTNPESPVQAVIQDFRAQTNNGNPIIPSSNYTLYNIASRAGNNIGIGNPGAPNSRVQYNDVLSRDAENGVDRVNALNPFYFNPSSTTPWAAASKPEDTKDIIKFAFECLDNDVPEFSVALIFRAFLDGQITDTSVAELDTFKYLGRGETFRTYQGFDRTISFSFKIFMQSRQEMLPLYTKLNQLVSQIYPDYSPQYNLLRGNVVRLTIGDYIYRTPGFLENVNITIDNTNTPWEIALGQFDESDVRQLPQLISVQCTFKPIMDLLPRKVSINNPFVPLVVNKDHYLDPTALGSADKGKVLGSQDYSKPLLRIVTNVPSPEKAQVVSANVPNFFTPTNEINSIANTLR